MNTTICIASGPSLTAGDCLLATNSGHPVIAVNSSWEVVPECQHIYAADRSWWTKYHRDIPPQATGWTSSMSSALRYGLNYFSHPDNKLFNSGQRAIQLAAYLGASQILLLGYDGSLDGGLHWHGAHPAGLENPDDSSITRWHQQFSTLPTLLPGIEIINCSRSTALKCFRRETLDGALARLL